MFIKILLWSLLLIVPGIVAAFRYALAPYLMAEHPELTATEAIEQSKQIMLGHKGRLFCLQLSFIGWYCSWPLTVESAGSILAPYVKAAMTAFIWSARNAYRYPRRASLWRRRLGFLARRATPRTTSWI
jgi:hypothetical protein